LIPIAIHTKVTDSEASKITAKSVADIFLKHKWNAFRKSKHYGLLISPNICRMQEDRKRG